MKLRHEWKLAINEGDRIVFKHRLLGGSAVLLIGGFGVPILYKRRKL